MAPWKRNWSDRPRRPQPQRRKRTPPPPPIPTDVVHQDGTRTHFLSVKDAKVALAYLVMYVFPKKKSPDEPKKAWLEKYT